MRRRRPSRSRSAAVLPVAALLALPGPAAAQDGGAGTPSPIAGGVHAIALVTRIDPALAGEARTEMYLSQPMLTARLSARSGQVTATASLNLEGLFMSGGEFALGNAGEGYIDRRHPHTYLHELIVTGALGAGAVGASLSAGRGFAPFGTDDPMVRPFVKYPANHHWSQILERWVVIGAVRRGPLSLEAGLFNGDEPERPSDLGRLGRFADSWASRLTWRPAPGLEAQASYASVASPEFAEGFGLDQTKRSASVRVDRELAPRMRLYTLLEWAETHEFASGRKAFLFTTVLAETALQTGEWRIGLRYERTTRPEEERLLDPFRSSRPHSDENILGVTRWNLVTVHAAAAFSFRGLRLEPFVEAAVSDVAEITGAIFDPREFYGGTRLGSLSAGLRLRAGLQHARMGRYGEARPAHGAGHDHE